MSSGRIFGSVDHVTTTTTDLVVYQGQLVDRLTRDKFGIKPRFKILEGSVRRTSDEGVRRTLTENTRFRKDPIKAIEQKKSVRDSNIKKDARFVESEKHNLGLQELNSALAEMFASQNLERNSLYRKIQELKLQLRRDGGSGSGAVNAGNI